MLETTNLGAQYIYSLSLQIVYELLSLENCLNLSA